MSKILKEEIQIHNQLNPKIWGADNLLLPEVRNKIIEIVEAFENYLDLPIQILDAQIVGSNASYNYNEHSDLDVHIMANFEVFGDNEEVLKAYYDAKKASFNKNTDIKIRGIDVEIYVQDIRSATISNGIYSLCDNAWIKEPKPITKIVQHNIETEVNEWTKKINEVLDSLNYDEVNDCLNALYLMRTNSIASDGEYGKGNAIFKEIRNLGLLDKLKEALMKSMSKELSLESLSLGQFIHRYED